jgi:sulfur carrier protein
MSPISLIIGEETKELEAHHVNDLIAELNLPSDGRGIAIAVNDTVVSKSQWHSHELHNGDRIEIVRAMQGG